MRLWQIHNHTPFAVEAQFLKDHVPSSYWCVWVKATFDVAQGGRLSLAAEQEPLLQAPDLTDTGIRADSDFYLPKAYTDVLVEGEAVPPSGTKADETFDFAVGVGTWSKRLQAHPARIWSRKGRLWGRATLDTDGPRAVDLGWESGFGGPAFDDNPVGQGHVAQGADTQQNIVAPRLLYPGDRWRGPNDTPRPAGFGPVSPAWQGRAMLAGTFDQDWQELRAPILPADHNPAWRQSAPADQQLPHLSGGEKVEFLNIAGAQDFTLPVLSLKVESHFRGAWHCHDMTTQSLTLKPAKGQCTLVYAGALAIGAAALDIKLTETHVLLARSKGFSVSPEQAGVVHGTSEEFAV